jgi:hypothetical protein
LVSREKQILPQRLESSCSHLARNLHLLMPSTYIFRRIVCSGSWRYHNSGVILDIPEPSTQTGG